MVKAVVTAEEFGKIDKAWQPEYEPVGDKGEKYRLKVEPAEGFALGEVEKTLQALQAERTIRAAKEKALGTFVDDDGAQLDPAKARNALKKYGEMANWKPDEKVREQIEAMKLQLEEKYGAERKVFQEQIADLEGGLNESVVDAALSSAIAAHGANPLLAEVLRPRLKRDRDMKSKKHVARILDETGMPKLSAKTGAEMGFDEYFDGLKADAKYQPFFPGKGTTGTGGTSPGRLPAGGGGAGGQFRMQNKYAKEHPGEYAKMGDEARKVGKTVELHD